ncbi:MAG TPA: oxygen-independent coproporphyrinogen III oxidase [Saprospiraceae bacterium]|nr:oxygen-independent coproporphyrinogen III oxidase [Saprospiraceae bacterium]HMQ83486.1 oxygen-independent coproporphyrinogen III oxidase [Saprospiraceae bacterium]
MNGDLLEKYNIPAPRYTSYPTVPYWGENCPTTEAWTSRVLQAFEENKSLSLYIHLPYCENLCTYCGCNKRITKNHEVEMPYLLAVLQEWALYTALLPEKPVLRELHLGGGTPTFFSPENLHWLLSEILETVELPEHFEFGFEAHPANATYKHLKVLRQLGFTRISIGVQDFDDHILKTINRQQSYEEVAQVVAWARELGYRSINFDLIFGLPFQTPAHIRDNVQKVAQLRPDRLAFYSYAHVPWIKPSQRAYSEADLPNGTAKRALYELGRELLESAGYREIGMDHFALPGDSLYKALETGSLHRNFMGYTPFLTRLSLALGASSISDAWSAFVQNEKHIEKYQELVHAGRFPFVKGHLLTEEDQVLRSHILNIICRGTTEWKSPNMQCEALYDGLERLHPMIADGLVKLHPFQLEVTPAGKAFVRNICLALDARYWKQQPEGQLFSRVV